MSLPIELSAGTAPRGLSVGLIPAQEGANKGGSQGQSGPEWELSNNRPTLGHHHLLSTLPRAQPPKTFPPGLAVWRCPWDYVLKNAMVNLQEIMERAGVQCELSNNQPSLDPAPSSCPTSCTAPTSTLNNFPLLVWGQRDGAYMTWSSRG